METKVLMIYPEIPDTYWSLSHALPFVGKKTLMPPLGLMTIAALLPENWKPVIVDMNAEELTDEHIQWADIVFISAMLVQKQSFNEAVRRCSHFNKPIAAGGPFPTACTDEIDGVDYLILDEGEVTLPRFIEDYQKGTPQRKYRSTERADMAATPVPRFDLIKHEYYATIPVQTSRGCPYNCEFCDIIELFGRKPRYKEDCGLKRELDAVHDTGYRGPVFIVDDNFIGNRGKVMSLLTAINEWQREHDYPFTFYTEASINLAGDEELMDAMVDAGFNMVFVGIETPDKKSLEANNKNQNVREELDESVYKIQSKGIEVLAGFIVGFDTDPEDIFERQIEFIQETGIPMAMIGMLMALPGTQLMRRLEKEGRMRFVTSGNNTHNLDMNFEPVMNEQVLITGYLRVLSSLYNPKEYFDRCKKLIKRMPYIQNGKRKLLKGDLRALFTSLYKQGFSRYGFRYFGFLISTLFHDISKFPSAVNLAVKGHHFFKITEEIIKGAELTRGVSVCQLQMELEMQAIKEKQRLQLRKQIEKCHRRYEKKLLKRIKTSPVYREKPVKEKVSKKLAGQLRLSAERSLGM